MRRALADAGRRAVEVDRLIVAAPDVPTPEACRRLARRALGPHGLTVAVLTVAIESDDADVLARRAADSLAVPAADVSDPGVADGEGLAVCVALGPDGRTVALCLDRQPGRISGQQHPGDEADDGTAQQ